MALTMTMTLSSPAFKNGASIPKAHTCDGDDLSPELRWDRVPPKTRSFVLIVDDPDAPAGTWVHWVLYDIPAGLRMLPQGAAREVSSEAEGINGASWGVETFQRVGYYGPCPPPGKPHRYFFKLYALDAPLGLGEGATKSQVVKAMGKHVLAEAELIGLYGR